MCVLRPADILMSVREFDVKGERAMLGRTLVTGLMVSLVLPTAAIAAESDAVLRRDEEAAEVMVMEDDGDDFTGNTGDSGDASGDSNDATGSRHTGISWDRDRSRGDLTRDWTQDGAGDGKRDWSGGHTNDSSRNDTR
jgi:hypothetical protein